MLRAPLLPPSASSATCVSWTRRGPMPKASSRTRPIRCLSPTWRARSCRPTMPFLNCWASAAMRWWSNRCRFISPEETREFTAALREVVEKGVTRNARLNPRSASGETISTTLNASALRDATGTVIGAIGILRDMRELDKARAYAESLIKNAPDPVFVSDLEGKILQANDAVSQLLGFRRDEVVEQSLSRFISPEETREFTAALREVVEKGVTRNA